MDMTASITVKHGMMVQELSDILNTVPPSAIISVSSHAGDRNYSDWHTIDFRWKI